MVSEDIRQNIPFCDKKSNSSRTYMTVHKIFVKFLQMFDQEFRLCSSPRFISWNPQVVHSRIPPTSKYYFGKYCGSFFFTFLLISSYVPSWIPSGVPFELISRFSSSVPSRVRLDIVLRVLSKILPGGCSEIPSKIHRKLLHELLGVLEFLLMLLRQFIVSFFRSSS